MLSADGKRVELVDEGESSSATPYIGLGLIGSLIVGFAPLLDAIQGNGPFESAMLRFLACVAVSVGAAAIIGRILDSAPPAGAGADPEGGAEVDGGSGEGDIANSSDQNAGKSEAASDGTG